MPRFLAEHRGPVSFLHVDANLYSSARTVLAHVGPRLRPGTVILFDEYFNYAGWEEHEHRAWREFVAGSGMRFRYAATPRTTSR
nr:class I SAM-dependent methyltransferase [Geodermatophilus chilensis]